MVILGTIRFLGTLTDFVGGFIEAWRFQAATTRVVSWWLADNRLILVLCASWPMAMSVGLRRTRWRELLPAAAATFLVLSVGGLVALILDLSHAQGRGTTFGSFHLTRRTFLRPTPSDVLFGVLGAIQLVCELVAAARTMHLISQFRAADSIAKPGEHKARPASAVRPPRPLHVARLPGLDDPDACLVDLPSDPQ